MSVTNTQLIDEINTILAEGEWVFNKRTGKNVLTIPGFDAVYDVDEGIFPLETTREAPWKSAIKEIIGYIRGYHSAADFRVMKVKTWDANANENKAWLANPYRQGEDDMGQAYRFRPVGYVPMIHRHESDSMEVKANYEGEGKDQVRHIYEMLSKGEDDRGLIATAWRPETFDKSCLRPCMHTWAFGLIGDKVTLRTSQRSKDTLLGGVFNAVQTYFLLAIFSQITGNRPGKAKHCCDNSHIYEDQYEVLMTSEQYLREPFPAPKLWISPEINSLEMLETFDMDDFDKYFKLEGYECHPAVVYPFSV